VETKTCPGCSEDVPAEAARCKHCFHDFNAVKEKKTSPVLTLLVLFAAMAVLGGGTFWWVSTRATECKVDISQERASITWVCQYATGPKADRVVKFGDVDKVLYESGGQAEDTFVVSVCLKSGDCHEVDNSRKPLEGTAMHIAQVVGVEVEKAKADSTGLGQGMMGN
jgi:hypothetical protein